jgi:hypothetical protein
MKLKVTEKIFIYAMIVIGVAFYQLIKLIPEPGFMLKDLEEEAPQTTMQNEREDKLSLNC